MYSDDQQGSLSALEMEDRESLELVRKRRTSIDALDLHIDLKNVNANQPKRRVSQIDNLRHKFHQYHGLHRKPSTTSSAEGLVEGPKKRKVSQIDVFRSKFLAYYGGKTEGPGVLDTLSESVKTRESDSKNESRKTTPPLLVYTPSSDHSEAEELPRFSSSPPAFLCDNNNKDNALQQNFESEHKDKDLVSTKSQSSRLSLASVLEHSKLITVTLNKKVGEGWGIELVHVTKTGSSMGQHENDAKEEEKVVYVQHNGNGQNSIMGTSRDITNELPTPSGTSTPSSASSSDSSEHEITAILGTTSRSSTDIDKPSDDMRHFVHKQNLRRKMGFITNVHHLSPEGSPILSRPGSASHLRPINPLPSRPSSALAQWRREGSPQHRPGVRIVALTEGGVAERSNELAVDDLIVEVKTYLLTYNTTGPEYGKTYLNFAYNQGVELFV